MHPEDRVKQECDIFLADLMDLFRKHKIERIDYDEEMPSLDGNGIIGPRGKDGYSFFLDFADLEEEFRLNGNKS